MSVRSISGSKPRALSAASIDRILRGEKAADLPNPNQASAGDQPENRGLVGVQRPDSVAGLRGFELPEDDSSNSHRLPEKGCRFCNTPKFFPPVTWPDESKGRELGILEVVQGAYRNEQRASNRESWYGRF